MAYDHLPDWHMRLSCAAYRVQDWFRQTRVASWLFYRGARYQHFGLIAVDGQVDACWHNAGDGDRCFDLLEPAHPLNTMEPCFERWHCEATVCNPDVQKIASTLHIGQSVRVTGTRTYDPPHHIGPKKFVGGKQEIHPCTRIELLDGSREVAD